MKANRTENRAAGSFRAVAGQCILLAWLLWPCGGVLAQGSQPAAAGQPAETSQQQPSAQTTPRAALPERETVPALFLSDIHFDPFWDPAKVPQLTASPASEWKAIPSSMWSLSNAVRWPDHSHSASVHPDLSPGIF